MTNAIATAVGLAAIVTAPSLARAQESRPDRTSEAAVEVTPHVSLGSAASSGFGAAIRWPLGSNLSIEAETGLRRAELNALSTNVSVLFDLPALGPVTPYVAGGIGLDQFGYTVGSPEQGRITHTRTAFTLNAGGGIRVSVSDHWGVRTDARWFNGLGSTAPERWRVYNGVTFGRGGH